MQDLHSNTEHTEPHLNDSVILQLLPESILIFPFILYFINFWFFLWLLYFTVILYFFEKAPTTPALIENFG